MDSTTDKALHDETEFTPHAAPGWSAWDAISPEVDVCRFLGLLARMVAPAVILETGVGAGRITRYLDLSACQYLGFEADAQYRTPACQPMTLPGPMQMSRADLVILDSDPPWRMTEIAAWASYGKPGSVCFVHDAGNGHPHDPELVHNRIRTAIDATGLKGIFLRNPRGAWLAQHP